MPDIQYFQGGYEEEKHDRALFGLLGGHDQVHIHFNANGAAPARDVWEQHTEVLGGLLGKSHDLHVHQDPGANGSGETDIRVHDGSILGGLVIDDHRSDFKTQRLTAGGVETRETHDSYGTSVGGMLAQGHNLTEKVSVQGADGVTRTDIKHEGSGSILGGVIGASDNKCEISQVTTPDGRTVTTHLKSDSSAEALCGVAAEGRSHTEWVDNGQGKIGIHTYSGSILGGVIYAGDHGSVYGADLPGAQNYLDVPSPYVKTIPGVPTPDLSESSYNGPAIAPAADAAAPQIASAGDAPQAPAPATAQSGDGRQALAATTQAGDLTADGYMGKAHPQVVQNFNDPDTNKPIAQANILRFDNGDYFVADGTNVRMIDAHNHRVNFAQRGDVAVAQSPDGDDMIVDPATHQPMPRLTAKVTGDGQGVQFNFANGLSVSADKNGDYVTKETGTTTTDNSSGDSAAPPPPVQQLVIPQTLSPAVK